MTTEYGKRLKLARKHARMTQRDLAERVGTTQSNLSELEARGYSSGLTTQLAEACHVSANWLATGNGSMLDESSSIAVPAPIPFPSVAPGTPSVREGHGEWPTRGKASHSLAVLLSQLTLLDGLAARTAVEAVRYCLKDPHDADRLAEARRILDSLEPATPAKNQGMTGT